MIQFRTVKLTWYTQAVNHIQRIGFFSDELLFWTIENY